MSRATPLVSINPAVMHGEPVFGGTRVPVRSLFDWLEHGESLDWFLDNFPTVSRRQARAALRYGQWTLISRARATGRVCPARDPKPPSRARRAERSRDRTVRTR